jgi:XTP/dITP diphosphohydrolase
LIFVTSNKNKAKEIVDIANNSRMENKISIMEPELYKQIGEIEEIQNVDVKIVACDKVKKIYDAVIKLNNNKKDKIYIVCEDTGLYLQDGLMHGFPGAYIKDFFDYIGNDICKIHPNGMAIAKTAMAVYDGQNINVFVGEITGTIAKEPDFSEKSFGFDNCFIPFNNNITFSKMSEQEKNNISMRKDALEKLFYWFNNK